MKTTGLDITVWLAIPAAGEWLVAPDPVDGDDDDDISVVVVVLVLLVVDVLSVLLLQEVSDE